MLLLGLHLPAHRPRRPGDRAAVQAAGAGADCRRRRGRSAHLLETKKTAASALDGTYLLKTDRQDLADDEIWQLYILLTRVEAAFRAMKSP